MLNAILGIIQFFGQFWDAGCFTKSPWANFHFVGYPVGFGDKYVHVSEPDFTCVGCKIADGYLNAIKQLLVNAPAQRMPITFAFKIALNENGRSSFSILNKQTGIEISL